MPHGPVLSHTYNMITNGSNDSVCNDWISGEDDYCAALKPKGITANNYEDKFNLLSKAEVLLVDEIYNKYKHLTKWQSETSPMFLKSVLNGIILKVHLKQ